MNVFKKIISLFISLLLCTLTVCTTVSADGYLDNNITIEGGITEYNGLSTSRYKIRRNYVLGIKPGTVNTLAALNFDNGGYVNFYSDGKLLNADATVPAKATVAVCKEGEKITPHTVALYGDVDQSGSVTVSDVVSLINGILGTSNLSEVSQMSADVNYDKKLTASDIVALRDCILNDKDSGNSTVDYSNKNVVFKDNTDFVKRLGRTYLTSDGINAALSGAGISFNAFCKGDVTLNFSTSGTASSMYYRIYVDGKDCGTKTYTNSTRTMKIAENLKEGYHTFKLVYLHGPTDNAPCISSVDIAGIMAQRPLDNKKVLEVIGDSISAGCANVITIMDGNGKPVFTDTEGIVTNVDINICKKGTKVVEKTFDFGYISLNTNYNAYVADKQYSCNEYDAYAQYKDKDGKVLYEVPYLGAESNKWVSYSTDASISYVVKAADILGYDYNLFAHSGIALPNTDEVYHVQKPCDYEAAYTPERQSDIVLVNLFTNWPNFTNDKNLAAMDSMVAKIRQYSPNSIIIFGYGAMDRKDYYQDRMDMVDQKVKDMGGEENNLYTFCFPLSRHAGGGHPSVANNTNMAQAFATYVQENFE